MRKIKVGIVGYGNLGKALEELLIADSSYKLVAIFSRHIKLDTISKYNTPIINFAKMEKYKAKINTIFLSVGSHKDCEKISKKILTCFNMIDCFDTHAKMKKYLSNLTSVAKKNNKIGISAFGWDPGLLSIFRVLFEMSSNNAPITFWGKGVSQGHSEVLKKIEGVKTAIQFTIPNKYILYKYQQSFNCNINKTKLHKRLCYIALHDDYKNKQSKKEIIKKINNTQNYFKDQKTFIKFVSEKTIMKKQKKLFHQGKIINNYKILNKYKNKLLINIKMQDNPHFTAQIMLAAIHAINRLQKLKKYGNYSIFELPIYFWTKYNKDELINKYI